MPVDPTWDYRIREKIAGWTVETKRPDGLTETNVREGARSEAFDFVEFVAGDTSLIKIEFRSGDADWMKGDRFRREFA